MTTQKLTAGINKVEGFGVVMQNNLETGVTERGKNRGKKHIKGNVVLKISEEETHTFNFFEHETTNNGKENTSYSNLLEAMNGGIVSLADISSGMTNQARPSYVRISGGQLDLNTYYSKKRGEVVKSPRLTGRYISNVYTRPDGTLPQPVVTFRVEVIVDKVKDSSTDKEKKATLSTNSVNFMGNVVPLEFTTYKEGAEFMLKNKEVVEGMGMFLHGNIRNFIKETEIHYGAEETEFSFGEVAVDKKTQFVNEWVVFGGNKLSTENNWDDKELYQKSKAEYLRYLSSLEEKNKVNTPAQSPSSEDMLFGTGVEENSNPFNSNSSEVEKAGLKEEDMDNLFKGLGL